MRSQPEVADCQCRRAAIDNARAQRGCAIFKRDYPARIVAANNARGKHDAVTQPARVGRRRKVNTRYTAAGKQRGHRNITVNYAFVSQFAKCSRSPALNRAQNYSARMKVTRSNRRYALSGSNHAYLRSKRRRPLRVVASLPASVTAPALGAPRDRCARMLRTCRNSRYIAARCKSRDRNR